MSPMLPPGIVRAASFLGFSAIIASVVTSNPANTMGLDWDGRITPGAPAELVLLAARNSGEGNLRCNADWT